MSENSSNKSNKPCCSRIFCDCSCLKYSHLLHLDLALLICHAFAAFVLYNRNMMLPIIAIRLPRFVFRMFDTFCLRKGENADLALAGSLVKRRCPCCQKSILFVEKWFRAISALCFVGLSLGIQYTFIFDDFCDRYKLKENEVDCREKFSLVMAILIILNALLDFTAWRVCVAKYD